MRESPIAHKNVSLSTRHCFSSSLPTQTHLPENNLTMLLHNVLLLSVCQYTSGFTIAPSSASSRLAPLKSGYLDSINNNNGDNDGEPPQPAVREASPSMIDLDITDGRQSNNLSFRDNRNWASVNDDPRPFDVNSRSVYSYFVFVGTSWWQFYDLFLYSSVVV